MTGTEDQLRTVFRRHGMEPKEIGFNDNLDRWYVSVQADGSDDRFLEAKGEIGGDAPVDHALNFTAVRAMEDRIDGEVIPDGTVNVEKIQDEYFKITIEQEQ